MPVDLVELASNGDWPLVREALLGESYSVGVLSLALTRAVNYEHLEMSRLLIDTGADPNFCFEDQIPALFVAVQTFSLPIVELLLTHGADVNLRMQGGYTPLMMAVDAIADYSYQSNGPLDLDLVLFLLAQGADPVLRDDRDKTAADVARSYGWAEAVQVLEAHMA
ncbi:ankyrin repeat domain-containing protein [Deinococcus detaillensis]